MRRYAILNERQKTHAWRCDTPTLSNAWAIKK